MVERQDAGLVYISEHECDVDALHTFDNLVDHFVYFCELFFYKRLARAIMVLVE